MVHDCSGHPGPNESVRSEFMWRNNEENDLLRADTSCQPVQASGFFPLYDAVSDRVWYGQFLYVGILTCHALMDQMVVPFFSSEISSAFFSEIIGVEVFFW